MNLLKLRSAHWGVERRIARPSPAMLAFAVLAVSGIAYVTLCPISMRPRLGPPDVERFGAYFLLGLIVNQAVPRRGSLVLGFMVLLAFTLEGAQLFIPGRDGRFADACVKATGGILGALAGLLSYAFRRFVARSLSTTKSAAASPT